jgi:hypothetical protein
MEIDARADDLPDVLPCRAACSSAISFALNLPHFRTSPKRDWAGRNALAA